VVRDASGHETHWDKLVLATGSYPFVPPVPGQRSRAVLFIARSTTSTRLPPMQTARRGVVIGGGLLGLEAANALKQLGLETHVVEFAPNLMAVQLDNGGAAMLREKSGAGRRVAYQQGDDGNCARRRAAAELCRRRTLATDMVVFSAGIRPQDALARSGGWRGRTRRDLHRRTVPTSDPDVLAIGECALWENKIYGLVAPGYQMARAAAATLAGEEAALAARI
jgi:nitrite reductase (NADH) large subunit